jgi:type I restriction enzyme S subunit
MRTFAEVAKGYTWFLDGDVIFARITPCMQNGKAALAKNLMNAVGFGSTEFHVIRPSSKVTGEWLHALVRHKSFRDDAAAHFKGTAGQQRVPQSFLEQRVIPVPPISEQRRIVVYLDDLQAKVDALKKLQTETAAELDAMLPSILDKAFKGEL